MGGCHETANAEKPECKELKEKIESHKKELTRLHKHKEHLHKQKSAAHAALNKHSEIHAKRLADHVEHLDNKLKNIHTSITAAKEVLDAHQKKYDALGCQDRYKGTDKETA